MMNDELISAYLDGELTAEQKAQVEQALASDARLRRMHDDMRALRTSLQALPQHKLDADFSQRVLRAVRNQQPQPPKLGAPPAPEVLVKTHHGSATRVETAQHEPMAWRVLVWTIAGLAAVIMVTLFTSRGTENADLAQRHSKKIASTEDPTPAPVVRPRTSTSATSGNVPSAVRDEVSKSTEKRLEQDSTANRAAPAPPAEAAPRLQTFNETPAPDNAGDAPAAAKQFDASPPIPGPATRRDLTRQHAEGAAPLSKPAAQMRSAATLDQGVARDAGANRRDTAKKAQDDVLIVHVTVPREQLSTETLDRVFAKHAIEVQNQGTRQRLATKSAEKPDAADEKRTAEGDNARRDARAETAQVQQLEEVAYSFTSADVVYVEASQAQVDAAIKELRAEFGDNLAMRTLEDTLERNSQLRRKADLAEESRDKESGSAGKGGAPSAAGAPAVRGFGAGGGAGLESFQALEEREKGAADSQTGTFSAGRQRGFAQRMAQPGPQPTAPAAAARRDALAAPNETKAQPRPEATATEPADRPTPRSEEAEGITENVQGELRLFKDGAGGQQRRVRVMFVLQAAPEKQDARD